MGMIDPRDVMKALFLSPQTLYKSLESTPPGPLMKMNKIKQGKVQVMQDTWPIKTP